MKQVHHTMAGQSENYAYLGLYWTWGKQNNKPDAAMNRPDPGQKWAHGWGYL